MRREVDRMKGKLLGVLGVLLLAILAAPAIAATVYIEPNTTTVAPGDTFEVSLKVRDGTAKVVGVVFAFNASQVTFDRFKDFEYFSPMQSDVDNNTITYVGANLTGVDISTNKTFAKVVFRVNQGATGTISFSCIRAKVDDESATCPPPGTVTIVTQPPTTPPATPPPTPTVPTLNKGPINVTALNIGMLKLSDERIVVGGTITLSAVWSYYDKNLGTRYITILKWSDYKDLKVGNEINVAKVLDKAVLIKALPEDGGSDSWAYTASDPGYYVVVAFVNSRTFDDSLAFLVESVAIGKPTVSISVDRGVVAWGDYVKVKASMSTDQPVTPVKVFITGAAVTTMICSYSGSGVYSVKDACTPNTSRFCSDPTGCDEWWIPIGADRPEGTYVAKIDVGSGDKRAEATATFQVVKPQVTSLTVPLQHVIGRDLVIEGVSNSQQSSDAGNLRRSRGKLT